MLLIKVVIYYICINGFHFTHKDNIDDLQISVVYHTDVFCYHNAVTLPLIHWMQTAYNFKAYSSDKIWNERLMNIQSLSPMALTQVYL